MNFSVYVKHLIYLLRCSNRKIRKEIRDGRNEERNGENERPDKVIAITLSDLKHLFYCDNYWFSDSLFLDSAISFWIVSTDSFNVSSCSDVVALEAFVLSKISESI